MKCDLASEDRHGRFAGSVSVSMDVASESLEIAWSELTSFLRWIRQEAEAEH
jgi:hypothetical protein